MVQLASKGSREGTRVDSQRLNRAVNVGNVPAQDVFSVFVHLVPLRKQSEEGSDDWRIVDRANVDGDGEHGLVITVISDQVEVGVVVTILVGKRNKDDTSGRIGQGER